MVRRLLLSKIKICSVTADYIIACHIMNCLYIELNDIRISSLIT